MATRNKVVGRNRKVSLEKESFRFERGDFFFFFNYLFLFPVSFTFLPLRGIFCDIFLSWHIATLPAFRIKKWTPRVTRIENARCVSTCTPATHRRRPASPRLRFIVDWPAASCTSDYQSRCNSTHASTHCACAYARVLLLLLRHRDKLSSLSRAACAHESRCVHCVFLRIWNTELPSF